MNIYSICLIALLMVGCASSPSPVATEKPNYDIGPTETSATMQFEQALAGRDHVNGDLAFCLAPTRQPELPEGVVAMGCVRMTHDEAVNRVKNCHLFLSPAAQGIQCEPE